LVLMILRRQIKEEVKGCPLNHFTIYFRD